MIISKLESRRMILTAFLFSIQTCFSQKNNQFKFEFPQMGCVFVCKYFAVDSSKKQLIQSQIKLKVDEINLSLSDYRADSEINLIIKNVGVETKLSSILNDVLNESEFAFYQTKGVFDVTIGPMTKLWRRMKRQNKLMADSLILKEKTKVGFEKLRYNFGKKTINPQLTGMQLDLGGIAKGYTLDKIAEVFRAFNINDFLIEAGGNILIGGNETSDFWKVDVSNKSYFLKNIAISTSGDLFQIVMINGKNYSHIIDVKTGLGQNNSKQFTVFGQSGIRTDWLSTSFCNLNIKQSKKLAKKLNVSFIQN